MLGKKVIVKSAGYEGKTGNIVDITDFKAVYDMFKIEFDAFSNVWNTDKEIWLFKHQFEVL